MSSSGGGIGIPIDIGSSGATTNICTLAQVKEAAGIDSSNTDQDSLINRLIGAVTKFVEKKTKRVFTTGVATRLFDGNDKGYLIVDDFLTLQSLSLLELDNTVWKSFSLSSEIKQYPLNSTPKFRLQIQNVVSENPYRVIGRSPFIFPKGYGNVQVEANWGSYSEIPDDLEALGIDLIVARLKKQTLHGLKSLSIGEIGRAHV